MLCLPVIVFLVVAYIGAASRVSEDDFMLSPPVAQTVALGQPLCPGMSPGNLLVHKRCETALQATSVLERFPNMNQHWCNKMLSEIAEHQCDEDMNHKAIGSFLEYKFDRITEVVSSSEESLSSKGAWIDCASKSDSCTECLGLHFGAREYLDTTHVCEWQGDAASPCRRSSRSQPLAPTEAVQACGMNGRHPSSSASLIDATRSPGEVKRFAFLTAFRYETRIRRYGNVRLGGTITDAQNIFEMLVERNFHPKDILVYSDVTQEYFFKDMSQHEGDAQFVHAPSTKAAAAAAVWFETLANFASKLAPGDFLFFHFSGHGAVTRDTGGDELDGSDEWLLTPNGDQIVDDKFYDFLTSIPWGVTVRVLVDACHSEGFSDLPLNYNPGEVRKGFMFHIDGKSHLAVERKWCTDWSTAKEVLPKANIVFISGSQNSQTSADLGSRKGGLLTSYLLKEWAMHLTADKDHSNKLVKAVEELGFEPEWLTMFNGGGGVKRGTDNSVFNRMKEMLKMFDGGKYKQEPNLCAWPSLRDNIDFHLFDAPGIRFGLKGYKPDYDPAYGGPRPDGDKVLMVVPPICSHGGRKKAHRVTSEAEERGFDIVEELGNAGAQRNLGDKALGWDRAWELELASCEEGDCHGLRFSEADVVAYVAHGSPAYQGGVRVGHVIISFMRSDEDWETPWNELDFEQLDDTLRAGGKLKVRGIPFVES